MKKEQFEKSDIGARLASAIKAAGSSNSRIAVACGVTIQAVGGWIETGRIARRHHDTICAELGITAAWLLTGDERSAQPSTEMFAMIANAWSREHGISLDAINKADRLLRDRVGRIFENHPDKYVLCLLDVATELQERGNVDDKRVERLIAMIS